MLCAEEYFRERLGLYWIATQCPGRLAIMARPRAGDWLDSEIDAWRAARVDLVVSLLETEEASDLGLRAAAAMCRQKSIDFHSFPIPDRGVPDIHEARQLASKIARDIAEGRSVAIHCRAGIGRSSLIAACVLICLGVEPGDALGLIKSARGLSVPDTEAQRDWIMAFSPE